jgi:predicted MFS family arabinose efflux permease
MKLKSRLTLTYIAGFLMAVHFASVSYINSSLLGQFISDSFLSLLYILGSLLTVIFLLAGPSLLKKFGSASVFLFFIALEIGAIFGLGSASIALLIVFFFLIHLSADPVLYLCLDVNLEKETEMESTTGVKRSILLTVSNAAWAVSPLALVFLINKGNFSKVYFLSGIALIPLFFIVLIFFKNTKKATPIESNIFATMRSLFRGGDSARIIGTQFILNFFYAWMIIYLPLLLSKEIGFGWDKIGFLFVFMLLPFVIFQLPAGFLADKKLGEKEILITGFIIMAVATSAIPLLKIPTFWIWAAVLFATRIGASLVEVASETYFFKHVQEEDTGIISLFRIARPFAYVIAPIFAVPIIYFTSYGDSFLFLAILTLSGLFMIPKVDTK